jgi:hypothetical protein
MKELSTLFMSLGISVAGYTQVSVWLEDFQGVPTATWINNDMNTAAWGSYSDVDSAWIVQNDMYYVYANALQFPPAGNKIATSMSVYTPAAASDDWIMSPLTLIPNNCYFRWRTRANRSSVSSWPANAYSVKISTTGMAVSDYDTELYTASFPAYEWYDHEVDLSAYAGQTVSVAIQNNAYNAYLLGVDDMEIIELLDYDMAGVEISTFIGVKNGVAQDISGTLKNYGNSTVTSMNLNYKINGGATVTENLTGLSIAPMTEYTFTHGTQWTPSATGAALIEVWASNINGNADLLNTNDVVSKTVTVYSDMVLRRPLYEDFSSKECGPCASWNDFILPHVRDNWAANTPAGNISAIYYMQDFPGTPDPSYNADSETRYGYYGVSGIPEDFVDGWLNMSGLIFDDDWRQPATYSDWDYEETPSFIELTVNATKTGTLLDVSVDVNPLQDIPSANLKLHIAVVEAHYSDIAGFNGETDFYYVMRKMLPNGSGTSIGALTQYDVVTVDESYTFTVGGVTSGSYNIWQGMNNIQVVAFVQDDVTQEVYQTAINTNWVAGETENDELLSVVYPNPTNSELNIDFNRDITEPVDITLTDLQGKVMLATSRNEVNKIQLDISDLPDGVYVLTMSGETYNDTQKIVKK